MQIKAIIKKELFEFFGNYMGHLITVFYLFLSYYLTFEPGRGDFFLYREASLGTMFYYLNNLMVLFIPAICMKVWADEFKTGTADLLFSHPISSINLVAGKYIAILMVVFLIFLGVVPLYINLCFLGNPSFQESVLNASGSALMAMIFVSVSLYFSSITSSQVMAFICSSVVCFLYLGASSPTVINFFRNYTGDYLAKWVESFGVIYYVEVISRGSLPLKSFCYFFIHIIFWSYLTIRSINNYPNRN